MKILQIKCIIHDLFHIGLQKLLFTSLKLYHKNYASQ